jgi:hypothetical protein
MYVTTKEYAIDAYDFESFACTEFCLNLRPFFIAVVFHVSIFAI